MKIINYFFIYIIVITSFLMADLLKPSSGQYISYLHVLFEWEQEPDAELYNIQVSTSSNFSNIILDSNIDNIVYIFQDGQIDWNNTYYWRVKPIYSDDSYGDWIDERLFRTRGSNTGQNGIETIILEDELIYDGLTIMGDLSDDNRSIVFDKNGKEIWNDYNKNFIMNHINEYGQVSGCSFNNFPDNTGSVINYDNQYQWQGPEDLYIDVHEVKSISNGNYMGFAQEYQQGPIPIGDWTNLYRALGYSADGETIEFPWYGQAIVEWDENSNEVWRWNPFDHFSMNDFDLYGGTWWNAYFEGAFDWMHSNAFYFDEEESVIYFSSRHLSRVTKIDYPSGDIIWMIGMPSEYNTGDEHICTDLGFTWQHNVNLLDNGNITLFDNGNLSELFGESETTRALEFRVIDNTYCEMIWEYTLPNYLFGPWMGSVQTLPNGNKLINTVGSGGHALEVTSDQQLVWDASYNITGGGDPAGNYRTFRIPSIHPNAYSVIFDNYQTNESESGIYLSENILKLIISNKSGYKQLYRYSMNDSQGWFDSIESQEIFIDPYSEIQLSFDANYTSDITNFYFDIQPIYHDYDQKITLFLSIEIKF